MNDVAQLPWIDESALADRYPTIYHYTRARTLEPILTTGGLYATHYAHTNDAEELFGLRAIFPGLVYESAMVIAKRLRAQGAFQRAPSNAELERIIPADALTFHDAMVHALPLPFHLTCFSKHTLPHHEANGLLTLWRFYGGDGEGVALGFNTQKLIDATYSIRDSLALSSVYLDEVRYGSDDVVLRSRLSEAPGLTEMFLEFMENVITQRPLEFGTRQDEMIKFTVLAACAKHPDFSDEREIRLVAAPAFAGLEEGRRSALTSDERFMLLPYLEALERVIVGPSHDQKALSDAIELTLQRSSLGSIRVDRSGTPFRFIQR